jgi:peptidoglycan hydrolase-like protein with peptidoglycan-binding domain
VRWIAVIGIAGLTALCGSGCTSAPSTADAAAKLKAKPGAGAPPLRVVSVSPAPGATRVNGAVPVTVTYNQPIPADARLPALSPAIAGSWLRQGRTAVFTPAAGYPAATRVKVTALTTTATFTTGPFSTLRLQQLLAQLGYLPLTWTPAPGEARAGEAFGTSTARRQLAAAYDPPYGTFSWAAGYPSELQSFWSEGSPNTLTQGAITGFEADHGLPTDGAAGAAVWTALLTAATAHQVNTHGYSYAIADEHLPETLTIWHDGKLAFRNVTNTGIGIRPTPIGTSPVYEKLPFQIMQGTNPDGSHYSDPVRWVSYFNGGSAVHYFDRYSYGWPQSLGCVELPYSAAQQAYPLLPYGTLVTVLGS